MVDVDQPQERVLFCLKAADSFADCTMCVMKPRLPAKRKAENPDMDDPDVDVDEQMPECASKRRNIDPASRSNQLPVGNNENDYPAVPPDNIPITGCQLASDSGAVVLETMEENSDEGIEEDQLRRIIFELQTSDSSASSRDVILTVRCQLDAANLKQQDHRSSSESERETLRNARLYLGRVSALEYPPALAELEGMGTAPLHLYKSIAFDGLYFMALGPMRQLPDLAFKSFGSSPAYNGRARSALVQAANQRIMDLPRSSRIPMVSPFRSNKDEKQPGISCFLRRALCSLLWVSLIGLSSKNEPDNDKLLQASLLLDLVHRECSGINQAP